MRYLALACDYDGTLACDGTVSQETLAALERLLATGRKLILVTGRELDDLQSVFPHLELFERVVVENGALLYRPLTRDEKLLGTPPPEPFVTRLCERGVSPISVGRAIVATWKPHETTVLEAIRDFGLDLQVIFNKEAVMVLPAGVNKASGLLAALEELQFSPHNVAAIGDAENDLALLGLCECAIAVDNALPMVKERADFTTLSERGRGVVELIDELIDGDLQEREPLLFRHRMLLGSRSDGTEVHLHPYGTNVLIAGPSGSGKSTVASAFIERLTEHAYQFCVIDPEGDYDGLEHAVVVGNGAQAPTIDEVLQLLSNPRQNVVVNLLGLEIVDRPPFFLSLLPRLQDLRARTGRPHWLIVDEAHHLLPAQWEPSRLAMPQELDRTLLITVHPAHVARAVIALVDTVLLVGQPATDALTGFCQAVDEAVPDLADGALQEGEILFWSRKSESAPCGVRVLPGKAARRRHSRKYAEGELPPDRSFYFRGPAGTFNLRAQNLIAFQQLANGVDDAMWLHHLRRGEYSRWFKEAIKDEELSAEAARVENMPHLSAAESRALIQSAIEERYTVPASGALPMPGTDAAEVEKKGGGPST